MGNIQFIRDLLNLYYEARKHAPKGSRVEELVRRNDKPIAESTLIKGDDPHRICRGIYDEIFLLKAGGRYMLFLADALQRELDRVLKMQGRTGET